MQVRQKVDNVFALQEATGFTAAELTQQELVELPPRDLMITVTVLGIPVVGVHGVNISIS